MNDAPKVPVDIGRSLDPVLALWGEWQQARYVSLVLCRVQQRLETRMMVDTGIQVLTAGASVTRGLTVTAFGPGSQHAIACEAEVLAMTEALKIQDTIPALPAKSLAGIVAKLEMIAGADRDIGDPTDFPWPHIASVLRDLKAVVGELPPYRPDRASTRADAGRYWQDACTLVRALADEDALQNATTL